MVAGSGLACFTSVIRHTIRHTIVGLPAINKTDSREHELSPFKIRVSMSKAGRVRFHLFGSWGTVQEKAEWGRCND